MSHPRWIDGAALVTALWCGIASADTTLIVNARIVDGTGAPAVTGAVRIEGDRIAAVGDLKPAAGDRVVDARGLTLAPGFIDTHSHHDSGLFESRDALAVVSQGVTTIVAGNDGSMSHPVRELFGRQEKTPAAINVATYVGHGDLRSEVMGRDFRRPAAPQEVARMRELLKEGMEAGALGLSTGLEYDPGIFSATDELIDLAQEAARFGGRYISHVRSEDRYFWAAIDEIVRIGREAKIPVQVSHMKLAMVDWWGQSKRLLEVLDKARAEGVDITGDIYPYEAWHSSLEVLFPERDFTSRKAAEFALERVSPPAGLVLSRYSPEPALEGLSIAEIAKRKNMDPPATLLDLIARSQSADAEVGVIGTSMKAEDVAALIAWPHANICSDGALAGRHPRGTGAFTRVLRRYVRDQKLLTLEQAIHKMTGLSASHTGLTDRGVIRAGAYADLMLFDPETVADRSTFEHPESLSVGIHTVWVNGQAVFEEGKATGAYPGQALRRANTLPRAVTPEDFRSLHSPDHPAFSHDGRQIAYVVDDRIHVVMATGGTPRAVTAEGSAASEPYWSKDGRSLFFLSDRSGSNQLWKLPLDEFGEAAPVTTFTQGIESLNFSRDESKLLLRFTEESLKEAEKPEPKPFVITRLEFKEDAGDGYLTGDRAVHLYSYDVASKTLTPLTSGAYSESDADWSPDSKSVVFVSNREQEPDASYRTDLWLVAADNTDRGQSLVRLTDDEAAKSSPAWSPDGTLIAFLTAEDGVYGMPQLAVIPVGGGQTRMLTASLDPWISWFRWAPDGQWIYFIYDFESGSRIGRVRPGDGKLEVVIGGDIQVTAMDLAPGGALVLSLAEGNDAPELHGFARGRLKRLTGINDEFLRSVVIGSKEKVSFRSADGTRVEALVTRPPGFVAGRRYPTILHIHGGPVGQFAWGYDVKAQYFAANGYVVVEPNPRGSTGRGRDFVRAIYRTWGITDYDDVIAAVDHAIEAGYADPDRLAVFGYSYGGYMTNTVITRTDRFKAAASGAGHSLIVANYGHDIYQKWYNWELGVPWENREKYDALSPLLQAGKVTTPTIFLGGREDWNVPVLNAELFYQSLRQRGIDTQLVVYPDTHHGGWSAEFEKDYAERVIEWFDKYLK
ncbi:MAG: LpqB family beta-propeller domain-containing protein [Steroidobacteraceae bacterium]